MNILGIDTSTDNCSVGLVRDGLIIAAKSKLGRSMASEQLILLIDELLSQQVSFKELDAVAVSIGPGSYTGLRIGLSTAKGLALPDRLPILPVPTMAVLERVARQQLTETIMLFIKSHRELIYHVLSVPEKPLNLMDIAIKYAPLTEVLTLNPEVKIFAGPPGLDYPPEKIVHSIYPAGEQAALLGFEFYRQLSPLGHAELEPFYFTEFEVQQWSPQK
jgi:tRNA threonylcarbamoyladenosine biosynthesis protein TsaB